MLSADDPLFMKNTKQAAPDAGFEHADQNKRTLSKVVVTEVRPGVTAAALRSGAQSIREKLLTKNRFVTDAFKEIDKVTVDNGR